MTLKWMLSSFFAVGNWLIPNVQKIFDFSPWVVTLAHPRIWCESLMFSIVMLFLSTCRLFENLCAPNFVLSEWKTASNRFKHLIDALSIRLINSKIDSFEFTVWTTWNSFCFQKSFESCLSLNLILVFISQMCNPNVHYVNNRCMNSLRMHALLLVFAV